MYGTALLYTGLLMLMQSPAVSSSRQPEQILTKRGFKTTLTSPHAGLLINSRLSSYPSPGANLPNISRELLRVFFGS